MFKQNISTSGKLLLLLTALLLPAFGISAQTDNCCSVDRQCATHEDWFSGYKDYQNGQCAAPSPQPRSTPEPPALQPQPAAAPDINNCCFIGWQCEAGQEWISGYFAFQHDHCAMQSHWDEQWRRRLTEINSGATPINKGAPAISKEAPAISKG